MFRREKTSTIPFGSTAVLFAFVFFFIGNLEANAHEPQPGQINVAAGPLVLFTEGWQHAVDRSALYGAALIVSGDVDQNGSIEIAVMPMTKRYSVERFEQKTVETSPHLQITASYRHWFVPWFSGGLGFFSSYVMGNAEQSEPGYGDYIQTSASDPVEYGFEASIQFEGLKRGKYSMLYDMRFAHSVTPKGGEEGDDFKAIIAFKYQLQERGQEE